MFNDDQKSYMAHLDGMQATGKCWCGWYTRGKCPNGCDPDYSAADALAARCGHCGNWPHRPGERIVHVAAVA